MLTDEDIIWGYRILLQRDPETQDVIKAAIINFESRHEFISSIKNSEEYKKQAKNDIPSRFWHYSSVYDAIEEIKKSAPANIKASSLHATNFLGVKIRPEFLPEILYDKIGSVEEEPIPANWHADIAEWSSCLRAVNLSDKDYFTMVELGCGWGCWMNNLGVFAKLSGKNISLYGVEADPKHIDFARLAFNDNNISEKEYTLCQGIAGAGEGTALFPRIESGVDWGGSAILNSKSNKFKALLESNEYVSMPIVDVPLLVKDEKKIDLVHVDIQGAELELLTELFEFLCKKVKYIFIGTHSKKIESGLFDLFSNRGSWSIEMERPAIFRIEKGRPIIEVDGVQSWRNDAL
jgi:FkbM family methyltransferase